MRLLLASASPRRAALLTAAGFTFETLAVDVDENARPNEEPAAYVRRLATEKSAGAMALLHAPSPGDEWFIVGADTSVVLDAEILGKPRDDQEARAMLRRLSGRTHEVMTGVSLRTWQAQLTQVETTAVWFVEIGSDEIDWYVASGDGRDKAGAYGIQGLAARFVRRIEGSYTNVVGLPIALVYRMLKQMQAGQSSSP